VLAGQDKQTVKLEGGADAVPVAAGTYRILQYTETVKQADPNLRTLFISIAQGEGRKIEVAAGKTTDVPAGSPLTAALAVTQKDRNVQLSLQLTDSAGCAVRYMLVNGKRPDAPKFEIADSSGKTVHSGSLEYG
jgi:hypothetical protein